MLRTHGLLWKLTPFCALLFGTAYAGTSSVDLVELRPPHFFLGSLTKDNHLDFDGDGRPDATLFGRSTAQESVVQIIGYGTDSQLQIKQQFLSVSGTIATWSTSGNPFLGIASASSLTIHSDWPLRQISRLEFEHEFESSTVFVKDIDNDGVPEIVRFGEYQVAVNSLTTGALRWSETLQDRELSLTAIVTQLDSDPALEIAYRESDGTLNVVDGATFQIESHPISENRYDRVLAGRFIGTAPGLLVTGSSGQLFRTDPWESIWTRRPVLFSGARVGDLDGNGTDELVYYNSVDKLLYAVDAKSLHARPIAHDPEWVWHELIDIDLDERPEILAQNHNEGYTTVKIIDAMTGEENSRIREAYGFVKLTAASRHSSADNYFITLSTFVGAEIQRTNAESGEITWSANYRNSDDAINEPKAIAIVNRGLGGREEVMITGFNGNGYGVLIFFDAQNGSQLRTFRLPGGVSPYSHPIDSIVITDEEGNATSVLTCHIDRIREYDYSDGRLLWTSPTDHGCRSLWRLRSGEIVASTTGDLTAYDPSTKEILWWAPVRPSTIPDGTHVSDVWLISPSDAPEQFAVLMHDRRTLHFIDASTRLFVRTLFLPNELPRMLGSELIALPGGSIHHLLFYSKEHLQVVDGIDGRIHAISQNMGNFEEHRYGVSAVQVSANEHVVSVASSRGKTVFSLKIRPDLVFSDSFDSHDQKNPKWIIAPAETLH